MRRFVFMMLFMLAIPAFGQDSAAEQRRIDAERRALDAERRALDAERRAMEAERRTPQATQGASQAPLPPEQVNLKMQACQAAIAGYRTACARPSVDPLWETPECADARKLVSDRCQ